MLVVDGIEPVDIPVGEWVQIDVEAALGEAAGTWTLSVTLPGGTQHEFPDLACRSEAWQELRWVGFVSNGTEPAVFYLDDVELDLEE